MDAATIWSVSVLWGVMLAVYVVVLVLHELLHGIFDNHHYTAWLLDLLASAELTAATLTLAVVLNRFGPLPYAVSAVANLAVVSALAHHRRFPGRVSVTHPIRDVLLGNDTVVAALVSCVAMVTGGVLAATFLLPVVADAFRLLLPSGAVDLPNMLCGRSVGGGGTLLAVGTEAAAALLHIIIHRQLISRGSHVDGGLAARLFAFATVLIAWRGWTVTGCYGNAALSTAVHYSCSDVISGEFLAVYWAGPLLGVVLGMALYRELRGAHRKVKLL